MKERVDPFSDAVFSIIMTLLVFRISVPDIPKELASNRVLLEALIALVPDFTVYFLSFLILGSYWVSHNILLGLFAKTMDRILVTMNFGFLAIAGLIPFAAGVLANSPQSRLAIILYSVNVLFLTIFLAIIRLYILYSPNIQNPQKALEQFSTVDKTYANARLILNVASSLIAVGFSFIYTPLSFFFLLVPVAYGLIPGLLSKTLVLIGID